ncbi:endonuclease Q family protein [Geotalea uraniireducens]|uniref:DNA helicase UvrD n=1 Tax=Geotalea uraniireducens (strain Rf4) TaxID=351605 RepID=A5G4K5_GEOUR|nr:endonuclease Q family protein [Geotalea uraniireducens]ABQ26723.1 conserved hypothetical protein [Geotalea uraniireducens Rf4]
MQFIADLHIHSRYSRACSRDLTPENLCRWGQLKGINVIGTGDFTHPLWMEELQEKLEPADNNLLILKKSLRPNNVPQSCRGEVNFLLSTEISCIYKKDGKTRKVHALVFVPDFASALRLNSALAKIGNIKSDGRPILGLDARKLLEMVLDISPTAMLVPAHAWTPHFSVFGAVSGFDSLEECFGDLTPHIYAIETGLSSDPAMNWRLSALDRITLISNSDAHSPAKLGREATIFDTEMSYNGIMEAIKSGKGLSGTIEFFPEEGKYHSDGHRECGMRLTPQETVQYDYRCPSCGKKVTVGVLHRVGKLADRPEGFKPPGSPSYYSIIPLQEVIAETLKVGPASKRVQQMYFGMLEKLGNEFSILLKIPPAEIAAAASPQIADAIGRMRTGNIRIEPGYDGEFGTIRIF